MMVGKWAALSAGLTVVRSADHLVHWRAELTAGPWDVLLAALSVDLLAVWSVVLMAGPKAGPSAERRALKQAVPKAALSVGLMVATKDALMAGQMVVSKVALWVASLAYS